MVSIGICVTEPLLPCTIPALSYIVASQLFSSYAKVQDARALASVIGEDELSDTDKKYLEFGKAFETGFVGQSENDNRTIIETLTLGWKLLSILPKSELDRLDSKLLEIMLPQSHRL